MTEQEATRKEIRKAVREVFMKYKREGLWTTHGDYDYGRQAFKLAFQIPIKGKMFSGRVLCYYKSGAGIRLDPDTINTLSNRDLRETYRKLQKVSKEMNDASCLWRSFYKMKF